VDYLTDEQRRQTGWIGVQDREVISKRALKAIAEKKVADCAGLLFGFKAREQAHSELCIGFQKKILG